MGIGVALLRRGHPSGGEVLLVRRAKPPNAGSWSLPGGAQELGETAEAAARRELLEETGLNVAELVLAANVDSIHRDASGRVQFHYTILDFAGICTEGTPCAADDVSEVAWAAFDDLEHYALWSEAHRVIGLARALLHLD